MEERATGFDRRTTATSRAAHETLTRLIRYFISGILLATGTGKALDLAGFVEVIVTYDILPSVLLWPAAIGMTIAELLLAAWLITGVRLRLAASLALLMHLMFLTWISAALLRGLQIENCGCFGVFFARPLTPTTIVEDLVMIAICLSLYALSTLSPAATFFPAQLDLAMKSIRD